MPFITCFQVALAALTINKLRTALTMLGIIIGVGSVIAMVSIGNGASAKVQAAVKELGVNQISITPGNARFKHLPGISPDTTTTLSLADYHMIQQSFPDLITGACPIVRGMVQVRTGDQVASAQITGTTPSFPAVMNRTVRAGSFITPSDEHLRKRVVLLGTTVVSALFGASNINPVGQSVEINGAMFTVQGVLQPRGTSAAGHDLDDIVMVPLSTAIYRVLNQKWLNEIDIQVARKSEMDIAMQQVTRLLERRHQIHVSTGAPDDFTIRNQTAVLQASSSVARSMTVLLGGIASVSLIVGGIGIMNIMLVSVQERTREIGVRKAIGAKRRDILLQFLIEAMIMSLIGGFTGVSLGIGSVFCFVNILHWAAVVTTRSVFTAMTVSALVGLFFGIYPARKASSLNPIEALRYE